MDIHIHVPDHVPARLRRFMVVAGLLVSSAALAFTYNDWKWVSAGAPLTASDLQNTFKSISDGIDQAAPKGVIVMWSGTAATVPNGWALCDGTQGTPDLANRFVVGATKTYLPGASGGSVTSGGMSPLKDSSTAVKGASFTTPNHHHQIGHVSASGGTFYAYDAAGSLLLLLSSPSNAVISSGTTAIAGVAWESTYDIYSAIDGGGGALSGVVEIGHTHAVLPPYYALCFIMKI